MDFSIRLTENAIQDLHYFRKNQQQIIADAIILFLSHDANFETRRRKPLRANALSEWELRVGDFRVFYDFEADNSVAVVAVGEKRHNDLYIRGEKVEL